MQCYLNLHSIWYNIHNNHIDAHNGICACSTLLNELPACNRSKYSNLISGYSISVLNSCMNSISLHFEWCGNSWDSSCAKSQFNQAVINAIREISKTDRNYSKCEINSILIIQNLIILLIQYFWELWLVLWWVDVSFLSAVVGHFNWPVGYLCWVGV